MESPVQWHWEGAKVILVHSNYTDYTSALEKIGLETLEQRRYKLCENFVKKAIKDPKHKQWFDEYNQVGAKTRSDKTPYITPLYRLERYHRSPIPYLTDILNSICKSWLFYTTTWLKSELWWQKRGTLTHCLALFDAWFFVIYHLLRNKPNIIIIITLHFSH